MGYDPGGVEQVRCLVLFDPFEVGIDFPICTVGSTHGYSHSGPSGAGLSGNRTPAVLATSTLDSAPEDHLKGHMA